MIAGDRPLIYFSSHHSFSLRTCSSSCGEKSLAVDRWEGERRISDYANWSANRQSSGLMDKIITAV